MPTLVQAPVMAAVKSGGFTPLDKPERWIQSTTLFIAGMMVAWQAFHEGYFLKYQDYLNVNDHQNIHLVRWPVEVAMGLLLISAAIKAWKYYQFWYVKVTDVNQRSASDMFFDFIRIFGYVAGVGLFLGGQLLAIEYHPLCQTAAGASCYVPDKFGNGYYLMAGGLTAFTLWISMNGAAAQAFGAGGMPDFIRSKFPQATVQSAGSLPLSNTQQKIQSGLLLVAFSMFTAQVYHEAYFIKNNDYLNVNDHANAHLAVWPVYVGLGFLFLAGAMQTFKACQYYQLDNVPKGPMENIVDFIRIAGYMVSIGLIFTGYYIKNNWSELCDGLSGHCNSDANIRGNGYYFIASGIFVGTLWVSSNRLLAEAFGSDGYAGDYEFGYENPSGSGKYTVVNSDSADKNRAKNADGLEMGRY
jgi:hypothetical protein